MARKTPRRRRVGSPTIAAARVGAMIAANSAAQKGHPALIVSVALT